MMPLPQIILEYVPIHFIVTLLCFGLILIVWLIVDLRKKGGPRG